MSGKHDYVDICDNPSFMSWNPRDHKPLLSSKLCPCLPPLCCARSVRVAEATPRDPNVEPRRREYAPRGDDNGGGGGYGGGGRSSGYGGGGGGGYGESSGNRHKLETKRIRG